MTASDIDPRHEESYRAVFEGWAGNVPCAFDLMRPDGHPAYPDPATESAWQAWRRALYLGAAFALADTPPDPPPEGQRFVVAEVSVTYPWTEDFDEVRARVEAPMGTLGKRFEHVLDVNAARGYLLRDWRFTSVPVAFKVGSLEKTHAITETIVAVFELEKVKP